VAQKLVLRLVMETISSPTPKETMGTPMNRQRLPRSAAARKILELDCNAFQKTGVRHLRKNIPDLIGPKNQNEYF
jgi:hypothetical protein